MTAESMAAQLRVGKKIVCDGNNLITNAELVMSFKF